MNINEKNFVFPEYSKASNISEFHREMLKLDHYLNLGMPKKFNSVLNCLSSSDFMSFRLPQMRQII